MLSGHRRYRHPPDGKGDLDVRIVPPEPAATRRWLPARREGLSPRRRLAGALTNIGTADAQPGATTMHEPTVKARVA